MLELGVAIGMLAAVVGLALGLAAIAKLRQQLAHRVRAERVAHPPKGSVRFQGKQCSEHTPDHYKLY